VSSTESDLAKFVLDVQKLLAAVRNDELYKRTLAVRDFLSAQKSIRVYIPNTPAFGHQSNSVLAIRRLIELGIAPAPDDIKIEVIFEDTQRPHETLNNLQKLLILLPEANKNAPLVKFSIGGVFLILKAQTATPPSGDPVHFGMTGGQDKPFDNLADLCNTNVFLRLQPYAWADSVNGIWLKANPKFDDLNANKTLGNVKLAPYYEADPVIDEVQWSLLENRVPAAVFNAVKLVVPKLTANVFNMMPVYGINEIGGEIPPLKGSCQSQIMFNVISGIRTVQSGALPKVKRGTLIVMISRFSPAEKLKLENLIAGTDPGEVHPRLSAYATETLSGHVEFIAADSADLSTRLDWLGTAPAAQHVLVLELGALTPGFFRYFYYMATLPSLFEGQNTLMSAMNIGKPFVRLNNKIGGASSYPLPGLSGAVSPAMRACQQITLSLVTTSPLAWEYILSNSAVEGETKDLIADIFTDEIEGLDRLPRNLFSVFIQNALQDGQDLKTYFDGLKTYSHKEINDKLLSNLYYLIGKYPSDE
jgi:hypothetical protein